MLSIFPLFAILGGGLWLSHIIRKPIELTLLALCCSIILFLFFSGLLGFLAQGRLILIAAGLGAFIWIVVRQPPLFKQLMEPGPVITGLVLAGLAVLNRHSMLISWDEYSHWGQIVRYITLTGAFPVRTDAVLLPDYPFGTGLFEYFVAIGAGTDERSWIFAINLLKLLALLPLFTGLKWKHAIILPVTAFMILSPSLLHFQFSTVWDNLLIDIILGLIGAGAVVVYLNGGADFRSTILAIPVFAVLPFLKDSGFVFGLVGFGIMFVDQYVRNIHTRKWSTLGAILGCLAAMLAVKRLWQGHLDLLGTHPTFSLSPLRIYQEIHRPEFGARLSEITDRYLEALTNFSVSHTVLTFQDWWMLILALALASIVIAKDRWEVISKLSIHIVLYGGFAAYLTLLYLAYLFAFSTQEGVRIASFMRYVNTYTMMWVVIALSLVIQTKSSWWRTSISFTAATAFVAFVFQSVQWQLPIDYSFQSANDPVVSLRTKVRSALGNYQQAIPLDSKVYAVWNNTNGLPFYLTLYELAPRPGNHECFSLGPARDSGDIWSCDSSPEHFVSLFKHEYDFLFLGSSDEAFWTKYGALFADGTQAAGQLWFRLDRTPEGAEHFVPVNVPKND
jgi:hypothetical protein